MRRPIKDKRNIQPDRVYNSIVLERFINYVMHDGEKSVARKVVYDALEIIKEKIKDADPIEVFNGAMKNAGPLMEVKSRRIGGANYQVPIEVPANRRMALAMRWLIGAARGKKGSAMSVRLSKELMDAYKGEGEVIKKRENVHKMAEANKAFAHFAW
ncbi:30S ribosomal protein S7 [Candidatus Campbellbacteria bacterium RIFCSPLOWO2_02_FULL_35_11]|uniref:Small ribosomal subunit protein uS7 n=2 Tax=Candidatus Campbelliibacteriota TaxID=1752727 RepID=A0A1F5EMP7_9BACT|nr:MAG: 30S ribosomal protein S7 [Candidatus Campbellbacteria bacterium RIFCSPHIGHO2_12_FULL_35_10]OGD69701.1 MAG: 30S ribosomal protein S7 [Candidatus Campbellbacteria bacterium RIFCSPLOWO2_02_FULL_35_11]